MSARRPLSPGKTVRAIRMYREGASLRVVAAAVRRTESVIRAALVGAGVQIRPVGRPERTFITCRGK